MEDQLTCPKCKEGIIVADLSVEFYGAEVTVSPHGIHIGFGEAEGFEDLGETVYRCNECGETWVDNPPYPNEEDED